MDSSSVPGAPGFAPRRPGNRVTPWIDGVRAAQAGLTDEQWSEYGVLIRRVHDSEPPQRLRDALPKHSHIDVRTPAIAEEVSRQLQASSHPARLPRRLQNARTHLPRVRSELLFQRAQQAKREAADAIAGGDEPRAMQALAAAAAQLAGSDEDERSVVLDMAADIDRGQAVRAAKRALADHHHKSRKRGRRM